MLRRLPLVALLALLLPLAACDSGEDTPTFDAAFFVGSWSLVSVSDGSGDRTADVNAAVTSLGATFATDDTFSLDAQFAGGGGQSLQGTYTVVTDQRIVLDANGIAPVFDLSPGNNSDQVTLSASSLVLAVILAGTGLEFDGTASLTIERD